MKPLPQISSNNVFKEIGSCPNNDYCKEAMQTVDKQSIKMIKQQNILPMGIWNEKNIGPKTAFVSKTSIAISYLTNSLWLF